MVQGHLQRAGLSSRDQRRGARKANAIVAAGCGDTKTSDHEAVADCHPSRILIERHRDETFRQGGCELDERDVGSCAVERIALRIETGMEDRKSTRLNSSHLGISYAVFCLKKKRKTT